MHYKLSTQKAINDQLTDWIKKKTDLGQIVKKVKVKNGNTRKYGIIDKSK